MKMLTNSRTASILRLACLTALTIGLTASPLAWAKKRTPSVRPTDSSYVAALAVADRFMAAWQNNDQAAALPLVTNRAKQQSTEEGIDKLFSGSATRAFEITRGRALRQGRFLFPAVLLQADDSGHTRRRFTGIIITNTGKNDWAVDKLP